MSEKFAFVDAEKARYPIMKMCSWLDVSTSGYYEWLDRPPSATAQRRKHLARLIHAIFDESDGTYGYRRIRAALARQSTDCGPELAGPRQSRRSVVVTCGDGVRHAEG